MSRSYKKFPCKRAYYGRSGTFGRRQANKKVRHLPIDYHLPNGGNFKKLYESCNIYDYSCVQFKEWAIKQWEEEEAKIQQGIELWKAKYHSTLDETIQFWKWYIRK